MADEASDGAPPAPPPPAARPATPLPPLRGASALAPAGSRRGSPLAFGSRGLALAIGGVLLAAMVAAGVLGYRDHRDDRPTRTRTVGSTGSATSGPVQAEAAATCQKPNGIPAAAGKPTDIPMPPKPVTELVVRDLKNGSGATAADGSKLTLQYVGLSCTSGKQIDSSWDRNEPLPVTLGAGSVIPGWDQGIKGMKVGGRRLLWIPASLAYGDQGQPPDIAPGDTLVFVIDLLKIG